ncbi:hypothetical protein DH2020_021426 [Rehmannia glutinosa]|uniref:Copper transport protein n=1 Tax=Rehmannia glutinosa TaxID=99300 RepID=A0ABR0WAE9_REHGL
MNHGGHMHAPSPMPMRRRRMMMHMTFFWGKNTEILFDGWPGYDHLGMYLLALAVVFLLAVATEWFSHCNVLRETSSPAASRLLRTLIVGILTNRRRIGLAYLVMLAVMSFNAGVFLVAVAGYGVGFYFFGSRDFNKQAAVSGKTSDLPPMNCC